jgi:uncharacterized membrane protein
MNTTKLSDVVSKKAGGLFIVVVILSLIALLLQNYPEYNFLINLKNFITKISQFTIYIGLIAVLVSSVTWKWERRKNGVTNQFEFVERQIETPHAEFIRRKLFTIGVFTSVYGTAMQAAIVFMQ